MLMFQILLRSLLLFLLGTAAPTYALANPPVLEVFVRDGCPHCSAAKDFLVELAERHPQLEIRLREVDRDPSARADLLRLSREAGSWPPAVPTFVIGERLLVGFDDAEHSGAQLIALVEQSVPQPTTLESRLFGNLSLERLGLPLFTLALGLLDGFNPCAMWVLLFLLSLLVRLRDRHRIALIRRHLRAGQRRGVLPIHGSLAEPVPAGRPVVLVARWVGTVGGAYRPHQSA